MQVATIAAFVASGFLLYRLVARDDPYEQARADAGALPVRDAIGVSRGETMAVRGFVFDGPGARELRLCDGRKTGHPPRCLGPFVSLHNADAGQLILRRGVDPDEGPVLYSDEPVTLVGTLLGTILTVQVVAR
jgi:hypothetical protein